MLQPISAGLAILARYPLFSDLSVLSLRLYGVVGLFGLPVVWMQRRTRDLAPDALKRGGALPPAYFRLWRLWIAFGFPAFGAVLIIVWLMLSKPGL